MQRGTDRMMVFDPDPAVAFLFFCGLLRMVMLLRAAGPLVSMLFGAGDELASELELDE